MTTKNPKEHEIAEEEKVTEEAAAEEESAETEENESAENTEEKKEEAKEPEEDESTRYMRLMADFQNYKKRVEKEKSDIYSYLLP